MRTITFLSLLIPLFCVAADFAWQQPQAKVQGTGDLQYSPQPFRFEAGNSQRYIDFSTGDDQSPGSRAAPWKHHPWDPDATGRAKAAASEVHTYIFKGGVTYRGNFEIPDSARGTRDHPIRITRDPDWGNGSAVLSGAERVTGWTRRAHPKMPEAESVWSAEIDFLPRTLWMDRVDGEPVRLKLARWPNWSESNPRDLMSEWPTWDQPRWWTDVNKTQIGNNSKHVGIAASLPLPLEDLVGGTVWTEWGIVMGSPYPARIEGVADVTQENRTYSGIAFRGPWTYNALEKIITGNRFYLEDLPQFLDEPGEFWVERLSDNRSRIYLRLPGDADPNRAMIEAGRHYNFFAGSRFDHIHWTGLTFRFGNMGWDYNHPQWGRPNLLIGAIRLSGAGDGVIIANNTFEHLPMPIRIEVGSPQQQIGTVSVADNRMRDTDHGAITISNSTPRGESAMGSLDHVDILRNTLERIGMRIVSGEHGHAVDIRYPATSHLAGNFLHRIGGWGLAVFGGKPSGTRMAGIEAPLSRHLIHHNRVEDVLLKSNDWGGIETWQGGSHYVYNNVVINALGFKHWIYAQGNKDRPSSFGHAYYMDGSFKNYLFNNIGLGQNNDVSTPGVNLTAIQNIYSFENWYFNNSFHRFVAATRQQAPDAGRFRYLGNVISDISGMLFRHADPKDTAPDPNASHYSQGGQFDYPSLAYAGNILHGISDRFGTFEETGVVYDTLEGFRTALEKLNAQVPDIGRVVDAAPLEDPDAMDWRPAPGSPVREIDVRVFVPWALARPVGEWSFRPNRADPNEVMDEHWFMDAEYGDRKTYKDTPRYPLRGKDLRLNDYVEGPYDTWTPSALRFDGKTLLTLLSPDGSGGNQTAQSDIRITAPGAEPRSVDVRETSLIVEAIVRPESDGIIAGKFDGKVGYIMEIKDGAPLFRVATDTGDNLTVTGSVLKPEEWHHLLGEFDRSTNTLTLYVAGTPGTTARLESFSGSLSNQANFIVGQGFTGSLDFLRVALSSLAESKTTFVELHAWQTSGPQFRDFTGQDRRKVNAAGALTQ
jgi:hypothetical protein